MKDRELNVMVGGCYNIVSGTNVVIGITPSPGRLETKHSFFTTLKRGSQSVLSAGCTVIVFLPPRHLDFVYVPFPNIYYCFLCF